MNLSFIDENDTRGQAKSRRFSSLSQPREPLKTLYTKLPIVSQVIVPSYNHLDLDYYVTEIYDNLFDTEKCFMASQSYMDSQTDINYKMRSILIDWLVSVHLKFKLQTETLFITVNIIDRYLEKKQVKKQHLQLVGISALLIGTKYEEVYPSTIKALIYVTDKAYTKEQVISMETDILNTLEYQISSVSSWRFFERISKISSMEPIHIHFSRYLLELALVEYFMLRYRPSLLAASSVLLSRKMFGIENY